VLVSDRRDLAAAGRLCTAAPSHGHRPVEVTTDRATAYARVLDENCPPSANVTSARVNNRFEPPGAMEAPILISVRPWR
jgi:hypothetical protein